MFLLLLKKEIYLCIKNLIILIRAGHVATHLLFVHVYSTEQHVLSQNLVAFFKNNILINFIKILN